MTTISPTKRRILGSLNPNASPCQSSKSEFEGRMEEVQATESTVLPAGCENNRREEEPARKKVCLDLRGAQQHRHQHQQIGAGSHGRRNRSKSASPPTEATVLLGKSTTTDLSQSTDMRHERVSSLSVLPALHPARVAAEGTARAVAEVLSVPMATQIAYPAGLVGNFNNHRQPKRTNNPRLRFVNQAARQKAEILRLRLSLAAYKIQTGQTDVPLEQLEMRSLLPLGGYHHSQGRLADGGASPEAAVDRYHDGSNSNPANWSFISNSSTNSNSNNQGHGYFQRMNHLRHAAGAAIEAVQAKQERRTAWREREQYREWYEQYGHHYQVSTWENAAAEQDHDGFSRDQSRQRQRRQQQQKQRNLGSGSKSLLSDQGDRVSRPDTTFTGSGTGVITTAAMTTTTTTSPHLNRLDLAERALQAHQRLQSRAVTEELLMDHEHEHEHEHDEIDSEPNSQQLTHHHHHQPQQQQRHRHHLDNAHEGWVVRPATENGPEVANDIAAGPGRRDRNDDHEEEESIQSRSRSHQMVGPGPSYSTEPELEPELPSLTPYQSKAGEKEEQDGDGNGDGDEAASGLLSLSRG
ncbi:hypothetical protein GE21DRAFT_4413 [Neurospora crassa]|uniref:Uncharacterized protein n=1 Tax=Neurospora crassa (strain ATCC 24698 / 74-OR23-1A / CBS 708.71 / DSM 1257 / FGSC 987) TaxID=367110 RepID=U9W327_NEUCR|nr:hypothetical protein NCU00125 [Neurospora crassa OR74A]ESA43271.1 hypothetical protein NCU00125 [Neurospora crassa OR74A]KHE89475.1 hypothetical protein GE21DRAFT_4413 [Neurospora crassa]|eukprot:XP_011393756.1 hypothetical protein NCU00125 [Neurospora crassa OR74A]